MLSLTRVASKYGFALLWLVVAAFLATKHVPWRDEYDLWLVATKTANLQEFFRVLPWGRNPPGEYLLYMLAQHLPWIPQEWIPRVLCLGFAFGNAVVISTSTTPRWFRFGVPFGILFLFDYGIYGRGYQMGIFFGLLGALAYRRQWHGLSLLLVMISGAFHALFTVFAMALAGLVGWAQRHQWRRLWPVYGLVTLGFSAFVLCQWPPPKDSQFGTSLKISADTLLQILPAIGRGLSGIEAWYNVLPSVESSLVLGVLGAGILALLAWEGFPLGRYLVGISPVLFVLVAAYGYFRRHFGVLFPMAITTFFFFGRLERFPRTFLPLVLVMLSATGLWLSHWRPDRSPPATDFSGSGELAEAKRELLVRPDVVLVVNVDSYFFAVMGRLNIPVFDARRDRMVFYPKFANSELVETLETWCQKYRGRLGAKLPGKTVVFGIGGPGSNLDRPLPSVCAPATEIFSTMRPVDSDESYSLYLVSP